MITEIIFIILTFLITGYGIYRFGREEKPEQQIEVQNNVVDNDLYRDNESLNININNEIINDNIINNNNRNSNNNINIINNGNTKNNTNGFKNQTIGIIERKKEKKNIDWGDLETTARDIENCFTYEGKSIVQDPSEEIKKILKEEKLKKGEEVVKKWIDKNKGEEFFKECIDNSGFFMEKKFAEIAKMIHESEENTYMFKNIDTDEEEKKKILKGFEIIGFLKKIRCDKKDLNSSTIIDNNENIININNEKMSFEKQVNKQIETNKKNIKWKDLPGAAKEIYNHLNKDAQQESYALLEIENILKEKKSNGEKEAAMNWLNKNKKNINIETLTTFVSSDENIYQNTSGEIIDILLNECIHHLSAGEENQLKGIKIKLLEKEEEEKQEKLTEEKLREQKEKLEEEKKLKEIEKKAKEAERKIVDEPQEGNPDVTTICFRYPDGEKIKNRRFLKSNKIQNLYDYVTSLGSDIYSEEGNSSFSLYQPFPPKKYSNMENTLEQEGLFPNAVVQIREE